LKKNRQIYIQRTFKNGGSSTTVDHSQSDKSNHIGLIQATSSTGNSYEDEDSEAYWPEEYHRIISIDGIPDEEEKYF
jgi:hypothetical protein